MPDQRQPVAAAGQTGRNRLEAHPRIAAHAPDQIEDFFFTADDDDAVEAASAQPGDPQQALTRHPGSG